MPDWRAFSRAFQDKFQSDKSPELQRAIAYYLSRPPKIQDLEDEQLVWKENRKREDETEFAWVIRSIGIVRKNLFHGGKFPWAQIRDTTLLSHGLVILYECLELDKTVYSFFKS